MLMSSAPFVIFPFPSAIKDPTRVKGCTAPVEVSAVVPVMENAYCPCRSLFENPVGGGGGVTVPPPLLHAPAHNAAAQTLRTNARFTVHLPKSNAFSQVLQASVPAESPSHSAA